MQLPITNLLLLNEAWLTLSYKTTGLIKLPNKKAIPKLDKLGS